MVTTPGPVTVLNVDDQEPERYIKSRDLRAGGFNVIEATTGAEALSLVEEHRFQVVLLDVQLPDINGYQVCAYIKEKWPEVMVLMTSATFVTSVDRTLGLNCGADSYLVQPAEPLELVAGINALVRIRHAEDALRALNASLEQKVEARVADLATANARLRSEIAQRLKAESALVQAEKMQAIGQLTGGLAHDFNNLLTAIVGSLDLIRQRSGDPRVIRLADNALKAAERGSKLTSQLLAFSRTQKLVTAAVDVNVLIGGMHDLLDQSLGAGVIVRTELANGLPLATTDATQLELAILNLAINARDAMPEGGTITISTGTSGASANNILISVSDTGVGMSPEIISRAFDPFYTTKPVGKGTGLGLSQVYGIVRQSGGDVAIESAVGKGTKVTLRLPIAVSLAASDGAVEVASPRSAKREKLLVVDDDADVREVVSGVLAELGYELHEASRGENALAMLPDLSPDLLIIDFAMPGLNGADVVMAAREHNAALKVLFMSGFADSNALIAAVGSAALLRKPFRPGELAAAVQTALQGERPG
jgi:signal transduction histidine kinase